MPRSTVFKPNHKAIQRYYQALRVYREQHVTHEGAVETAFQRLLADTCTAHGWTLLPKLKLQVKGKNIYPDGTLRDFFNLRRGFWEAKDTDDDLDAEISKKIAKGYPLNNTIFEDTRTSVLYQNGQERYRLDLTDPRQLASLLNEFYAHTEPEIDNFEQAVEEFKERVPELAKGLVEKIADAHKTNRKFQAAFASFFTLCQQTLNPNISEATVDEMLVQHLLTEACTIEERTTVLTSTAAIGESNGPVYSIVLTPEDDSRSQAFINREVRIDAELFVLEFERVEGGHSRKACSEARNRGRHARRVSLEAGFRAGGLESGDGRFLLRAERLPKDSNLHAFF